MKLECGLLAFAPSVGGAQKRYPHFLDGLRNSTITYLNIIPNSPPLPLGTKAKDETLYINPIVTSPLTLA